MGDSSPTEEPYNVTIVSYGHSNGPLIVPKEHRKLTFNVRDIPNPAVGLRKTHTGLSARLRKEVLASQEAQARLAEMTKTVLGLMAEMETEGMVLRSPTVASASAGGKKGLRITTGAEAEHFEDILNLSNTLVVGIVCEEGRHRSVSFAEELGRSLKRKHWEITIDHRDLSGYENDEPETPTDLISPTTGKPKKTKKQKNQETRRRKTSQRGFLNDEEE